VKRRITLSGTHIILLGFLSVILLGSLLLWLPISTQSGTSVSYVDALFTATTSTCVTGLVTLPTFSTWSLFGQAVILLLIQVGGLGVITVMAGLMLAFHRRLGMKDQLLIQSAFNLDTMAGLSTFVKKVLIGTFFIEGIGALLYMTVFIPEFGWRGIWISVFNSISAFCNAGIDIIGDDSLCRYAAHPMINLTTSLLIILGGLGYIVWWDILRVFHQFPQKRFRCLKHLTLHSKIVLSTTAILIFGGAVAIFLLEYHNPLTIGSMSLGNKIQISLFQSVTTRTAGFASVPQENLTDATALFSLILMFVGGSPVGTAGGIKTTTIAVLMATMITAICGREQVCMFRRSLPKEVTRLAVSVFSASFCIATVSTILLSVGSGASVLDVLYEAVSATATVGLSRDLTSALNLFSKFVVIGTMYLGRVGPISLVFALNVKRKDTNNIKNPTENLIVG